MEREGSAMYNAFRAVPREHTIRPFWFWNGEMSSAEVQRQIEAMTAQHIYGAYGHCRSGMRPRYLSEEWWGLVRAGVAKARELNFAFCMVDEYNWPSGEARDYRHPGIPSGVLAVEPHYRMRSLVPDVRTVMGPSKITVDLPPEGEGWVVTGRRDRSGELDASSLVDITTPARETGGSLHMPAGDSMLYVFRLQDSVGFDGGLVDLMNPDAVRAFIDIVYEGYWERVGRDFGTVFRSTFIDHEGDYGWRLAWTPRLFDTFRDRKGYDLVPMLPLLLEDGGRSTPRIRCDWFDVIADLYADSFFGQIADWGREHRITVTGHVWEESLRAQAAFQGDHFRIQRAFGHPGVDSLFEWGRSPRHLKEGASVAHFRELPFAVENQGVQGADSFLSLERIKRTTNMLAAWGTTLFIPHALNGNPDRIDFPEDWFERQPWWRYFHHYADYAARLSYMNSGGRHVAEVLLYYPIETAWAHSEPIFSAERWNYTFSGLDPDRGPIFRWGNVVDELDVAYSEIIETLPARGWDLDIADAHYLDEARLEEGRLRIAAESFGVLVFPPMTTIRLSAMRRGRAFVEAGGVVVAVGRLALDSMDDGRNDPALLEGWEWLFGAGNAGTEALAPGVDTLAPRRREPGRSFRVRDVEELLAVLERHAQRDARVVDGNSDGLYLIHRIKNEQHVYWCVNDTAVERTERVRFPVLGNPQRWEAVDGSWTWMHHSTVEGGTELPLWLPAWGACYVVFHDDGTEQPYEVLETTLTDFYLTPHSDGAVTIAGRLESQGTATAAIRAGDGRTLRGEQSRPPLRPLVLRGAWAVTPETTEVPVPHARWSVARGGEGEALGWHEPTFNDAVWPLGWLSPERFAMRDWWVVGPFDYDHHRGFTRVFPPEAGIVLSASYEGRGGRTVSWRHYCSPERVVDLDRVFGTEAQRGTGERWVSGYAMTWVYSPIERAAHLRVVADCNAKAWLDGKPILGERDDHQGYLELRDAYGVDEPVRLKAGWTQLLLKVSQGMRFGGLYGFAARICDEYGRPIQGVTSSATGAAGVDPTARGSSGTERWYRLPVPAGATAVSFPGLATKSATVFLEGARLEAAPEDAPLPLPQGGVHERLLALRLDGHHELHDMPVFELGPWQGLLGSLTYTALSYYVGALIYEHVFDLPIAYLDARLELDLGLVGTTAEVWVNGRLVGTRVWDPFRLDIRDACRPGRNALRIVVANTAANERARGEHAEALWGVTVRGPRLLDHLDQNGLMGPVRIQPYHVVTLTCR